jgi:hypothetical protein
MSFRLPIGSREYFKRVLGAAPGKVGFDILFDAYYFCLLVGVDHRRLSTAEQIETEEFLRNIPQQYSSSRMLIAALLIDAELERNGIAPTDRSSIQAELLTLLDTSSQTGLTTSAEDLLNQYAAAGFERIREVIPEPGALEDFLVAFWAFWNTPKAGV